MLLPVLYHNSVIDPPFVISYKYWLCLQKSCKNRAKIANIIPAPCQDGFFSQRRTCNSKAWTKRWRKLISSVRNYACICLPHVGAKWGGVTEARFSSGEEVQNWALTGLTVLLSCTGNLISHGLRQQESINEYHQTVREGFELLRSGWEPLGILLIVSCCGNSGQLMNL